MSKLVGFVYLWIDSGKHSLSSPNYRMFCLGSHRGSENDGYITSTGGSRFKNAYKKRPQDFRRRVIERIYEGNDKTIYAAEQRWLNMLKTEKLGIRYYNMQKGARGVDREFAIKIGRLGGLITASRKDENGKSIAGIKGAILTHLIKDINGKSATAVKGGNNAARIGASYAAHLIKDESGKSVTAVKGGRAGGPIGGRATSLIKDENGKSVYAVKRGRLGAIVMHREKDENGRSVNAIKGGIASGLVRRTRRVL